MTAEQRIQEALQIAARYGGTEEDHHSAWVVDQMVRALCGDGYEKYVTDVKAGKDGPDSYSWYEGIAP